MAGVFSSERQATATVVSHAIDTQRAVQLLEFGSEGRVLWVKQDLLYRRGGGWDDAKSDKT